MHEHLSQLGRQVALPQSPAEATLERIPIPPGSSIPSSIVRFSCPEFTSLCPVTGQPDFARIYVDFIPAKTLVESKSLKLFFGSFRNHGAFHEAVTAQIGDVLWACLEPNWLRVIAFWYPRGGIPIDVLWEKGILPHNRRPININIKPFDGR